MLTDAQIPFLGTPLVPLEGETDDDIDGHGDGDTASLMVGASAAVCLGGLRQQVPFFHDCPFEGQ